MNKTGREERKERINKVAIRKEGKVEALLKGANCTPVVQLQFSLVSLGHFSVL